MDANTSPSNGSQSQVAVTRGSVQFRTIALAGIRVTESRFPAGAWYAPHYHAHTVLGVMLEGGFDLAFPSRRYDCLPASVYVEPTGIVHAHRLGSDGARILQLELDPDAERGDLRQCAALLDAPVSFRDGGAGALAVRAAREIRASDAVAPLAIEALVLELLARCARRRNRSEPVGRAPPWLSRTRDYLHANSDRSVRLQDIAAELGVHRVHLGRVFRAHYGVSLGDYHRRLRVEWAAEQLAKSDLPLAEIALRAGFADQSHFIRVFRRLLGVTPLRYRLDRGVHLRA